MDDEELEELTGDEEDLEEEGDLTKDKKRKKSKRPLITSSMIYCTPELRAARHAYVKQKSGCCVKEGWKHYNKLANIQPIPEQQEQPEQPEEPKDEKKDEMEKSEETLDAAQLKSMGVLYDPMAAGRQKYLRHKYKYFHDAMSIVKEAPDKPYMRPQPPRELDIPGRGCRVPTTLQNWRPQIDPRDTTTVTTRAYTKKWMNTSNLNFDIFPYYANKSNQTAVLEILMQSTLYKGSKLDVSANSYVACERPELALAQPKIEEDAQFDHEDIPLDKSGNPIGKTTGYCEWCGFEILPIPTPHVLRTVWDRRKLYCCEKYRELVEEITALEAYLRAEQDRKNLLINIKPGKLGQREEGGAQEMIKKRRRPRRDSDDGGGEGGDKEDKEREKIPNKYILEQLAKLTELPKPGRKVETRHLSDVDTRDLVWDPRKFAKKSFSEGQGQRRLYQHASVVIMQAEVFTSDLASESIGSLADQTRNTNDEGEEESL